MSKKLEKTGFWKGKDACWELRKCEDKKGGAPDCPAYKNQDMPCWTVSQTMCKTDSGARGKPCLICVVWEKYHK